MKLLDKIEFEVLLGLEWYLVSVFLKESFKFTTLRFKES